MSGVQTIGGLASGLDTNSILSQLEAIERTPITNLESKKTTLQAKSTAWELMNTRLLAVKQKAAALVSLGTNIPSSASSTNEDVRVSASSGAVSGTYTFTVKSLASYHQLTSQTFADQDSTSLGTGTFSLTVDGATTEIDSTNLTLEGLRNAINSSNAGVQAVIVSSGGDAPQYRLMLTSETMGSDGNITINSTLAGGTAPTMSTLHEATDTVLTFGSGDQAFDVTRSSTTLTDVIPGVTMNIGDEAKDDTVTVTVKRNTSAIKSAIQDFVSQYNGLLSTITSQTSFDEDTGETGTLFGETQLILMRSQLARNLTSVIENLPSALSTASQVGITFGEEGMLTLDNETLNDAIEENLQGVLKVFGIYGTPDSTSVSFVTASEDTKVSGSAGYAVEITAPATQARLTLGTAGVGLPDTLGQQEILTLNGKSITLAAGLTRTAMVAAINAKSSETGVRAALTGADGTGSGNYLTFNTIAYGTSATISVVSDVADGGTGIGTTAISDGDAGAGNLGVTGSDVVGTINGETATGDGQVLTSEAGDARGLKLLVTAREAGAYGNVVFTRGIGSRIDDQLTFITDSDGGSIANMQETIDKQIDEIDSDIESMEESAARSIERMRAQFNAMEVALSKLQSQGAQMSSLISSISGSAE